jgi:FHIPEP family
MDRDEPEIQIELELGPLLAPLAELDLARALARRVESELAGLLEQLGLPGAPHAEVSVAPTTTRPLRIRVNGVLQPYSPHLAARAWLAVAPEELGSAPGARITDGRGFPAGWLAELLEARGSAPDTWRLAAAWAQALAIQVILKRPSCIAGPAQLKAYARKNDVPSDEAGPLVRGLLDLGVSVHDGGVLARRIEEGLTLDRSRDDTLEAAFADLRAHRIDLLVAPATLAGLLRPTAELSGQLSVYDPRIPEHLTLLFSDLEATFMSAFGLALPDLVWVPSPLLAEGTLVIAMDAWRSLPIPLVRPGERLVNVDPIALGDMSSRSTLHPLTGTACAIVDDAARNRLDSDGQTTWGPVDFVILNLVSELTRRTGRLLGLEEVEQGLAQLVDDTREGDDRLNPVVWEALERYTLGELTRMFRAMLAERLSLANLRTVLEHIVQFDVVSLPDADLRLVDDRLPVNRQPSASDPAWPLVYAYLRRQLKPYLTREYTWWENTVLAYELSPRVENQIRDADSLREHDAEAVRDALWTALGQLAPTPFGQIVLTSSLARSAVRELLAAEFPDLPVVARYELKPDVSINIVDVIDAAWNPPAVEA